MTSSALHCTLQRHKWVNLLCHLSTESAASYAPCGRAWEDDIRVINQSKALKKRRAQERQHVGDEEDDPEVQKTLKGRTTARAFALSRGREVLGGTSSEAEPGRTGRTGAALAGGGDVHVDS